LPYREKKLTLRRRLQLQKEFSRLKPQTFEGYYELRKAVKKKTRIFVKRIQRKKTPKNSKGVKGRAATV